MNLSTAVLAIFIMGAVTFGTRLFPFVVFRRHQPGPRFRRLQAEMPPLLMTILVIYSVKDAHWTRLPEAAGTLGCLALVAGLQLWRRNPLIAIFGGTIAYMAHSPLWQA
jgi:branched-subunit amino acid transport protein AzlD